MDLDLTARLFGNGGLGALGLISGDWAIRCYGPDGSLKWEEGWGNAVVNEGQDYLLDAALNGATQSTTWYIGLIDGGSPTISESDTLSSKGWTENQNYSEAARQEWVSGSVSSQSIDNVGNEAIFSIDTDGQTIGGAFLADDSTKGGTSGQLYAAGTFSSSKSVDSGDTLEVTATFTMATA